MKRIATVADLGEAYDLVVIGAGPAGLAAATLAAALGLDVLLADENPAPGGQIYRGITATPVRNRDVLGEDYWRGEALAGAFAASAASYAPAAAIWTLGPGAGDGSGAAGPEAGRAGSEAGRAGFEAGISIGGQARLFETREVIAATGALERPFPIPGWTLPGVMTAGAAQIALKTAGLVPEGRTVVAGTGPLLYLLVAQLRAAGAEIGTLLDTTPAGNWRQALGQAPDFLLSPYLAKGLRLLYGAQRGLRVVRGVTALAASGNGKLEEVSFRRGTREERLPCDLLLLHQGVVPNVNLSNAAGCAHEWDAAQRCWVPKLDGWFETSVPGLSVAGDGAGIAGAESAPLRGQLAALAAACRLGRIDAAERDRRAAPVRAELARAGRGRAFLDALFRPAQAFVAPPDRDTLVCRCEEVSAGQIRDHVALGVTGPNQMKSFLRSGMGPCQGRLCGLTVTEIIAEELKTSPAEVGGYRLRPPIKPVTLGELAALPKTEAARRAVER